MLYVLMSIFGVRNLGMLEPTLMLDVLVMSVKLNKQPILTNYWLFHAEGTMSVQLWVAASINVKFFGARFWCPLFGPQKRAPKNLTLMLAATHS
jgi:uncharacterized membrane protein